MNNDKLRTWSIGNAMNRQITLMVGPWEKAVSKIERDTGKRVDDGLVYSGCYIGLEHTRSAHIWHHIWLPSWSATDADQSTLAHECLHCVLSISREMNLPVHRSEEVVCQLFSHIVEQCQRKLRSIKP